MLHYSEYLVLIKCLIIALVLGPCLEAYSGSKCENVKCLYCRHFLQAYLKVGMQLLYTNYTTAQSHRALLFLLLLITTYLHIKALGISVLSEKFYLCTFLQVINKETYKLLTCTLCDTPSLIAQHLKTGIKTTMLMTALCFKAFCHILKGQGSVCNAHGLKNSWNWNWDL